MAHRAKRLNYLKLRIIDLHAMRHELCSLRSSIEKPVTRKSHAILLSPYIRAGEKGG